MNLTGHGIGSIYLTILLALLLSILPMPALLDTYRPDWVALTNISTGTAVRIGWLCRHIDWHWSPESSKLI